MKKPGVCGRRAFCSTCYHYLSCVSSYVRNRFDLSETSRNLYEVLFHISESDLRSVSCCTYIHRRHFVSVLWSSFRDPLRYSLSFHWGILTATTILNSVFNYDNQPFPAGPRFRKTIAGGCQSFRSIRRARIFRLSQNSVRFVTLLCDFPKAGAVPWDVTWTIRSDSHWYQLLSFFCCLHYRDRMFSCQYIFEKFFNILWIQNK